jgi:predicted nucleic acid-binding protein
MLYLDTSALVKKYVEEPHSEAVRTLIVRERILATSTISRAETAAAFSKALRIGSLTSSIAEACHKQFQRDWKNYVRVRITEVLIARADDLAWRMKLRGYDAVHLAAALEWQDRLGEPITLATFDRELWEGADTAGLERFPLSLK